MGNAVIREGVTNLPVAVGTHSSIPHAYDTLDVISETPISNSSIGTTCSIGIGRVC